MNFSVPLRIMLVDFQNYISQHGLFEPGDKILLAVSGGIDSVVMSDLFYTASVKFAIAHCNFGLRGAESDGDEATVRELARKYKVPFYHTRFDTRLYSQAHKLTIQVAARNLRREWLEKLVQAEGFTCYATAHHQDDMIETFFLNLMRGTGIRGLRGMQPRSGMLIHPMLFATREMIVTYAAEKELTFREDSSNSQNYYRRNKIRNLVIPELKKIQPDFGTIMASNLKKLGFVEHVYDSRIEEIKHQTILEDNDKRIIPYNKLIWPEPSYLYLAAILDEYGFSHDACRNILKLAGSKSGRKFYSEKYIIILERDHLAILKKKSDHENEDHFLLGENDMETNEPVCLKSESLNRTELQSLKTDTSQALFDKELLRFPLILRKWRRADYFYPFGIGKRKLLSDFFIDHKFTDEQKHNTWLLCSGRDIIWVVGHRSDDRYKIRDHTKEVFSVKLVLAPE